MSRTDPVTHALVLAFAAGEWSREGLTARARDALGGAPDGLDRLVRLALRLQPTPPHGRELSLARLLDRSHAIRELLGTRPRPRIRRWYLREPRPPERPASFAGLGLPELRDAGDVAHLVDVHVDQLDWLADRRRMNLGARDPKLRHYHYRWVQKRSEGFRLIEAPKPTLKAVQRRILDSLLNLVPPHDAAHGHRPGHSVATFVRGHSGRHVVVALDLREFFAQVTEARVRGTFRALGYADEVASLLSAICCVPTPPAVLADLPLPPHSSAANLQARTAQRQLLRASHLPQGAPTSPMLANLVAYRFDLRLSALARRFGGHYSRYADDLALSGPRSLAHALPKLLPRIGAIALEEGFELNYRKQRVMPHSQRQSLCGCVVNALPSLPRCELERLEAILVNCIRQGPASQNRHGEPDFEAHLRGRIAWVTQLHPAKGNRLRSLFERIEWSASP